MEIDMLDMWYLEVYPFNGDKENHVAAFEDEKGPRVDMFVVPNTWTPDEADKVGEALLTAANLARVVSGEKPEMIQTSRDKAIHALLKKIEWVSHSGKPEDSVCSVCGGSELSSGHAPECTLAGMLYQDRAGIFYDCMKQTPVDALCWEYENSHKDQNVAPQS